jgi:hypothetical protein
LVTLCPNGHKCVMLRKITSGDKKVSPYFLDLRIGALKSIPRGRNHSFDFKLSSQARIGHPGTPDSGRPGDSGPGIPPHACAPGPMQYHRLRVTCPIHPDCSKYRNTGQEQRGELGHDGPVAYLGCWILAASRVSRHDHKYKYRPSWAEMRRYVASKHSMPVPVCLVTIALPLLHGRQGLYFFVVRLGQGQIGAGCRGKNTNSTRRGQRLDLVLPNVPPAAGHLQPVAKSMRTTPACTKRAAPPRAACPPRTPV